MPIHRLFIAGLVLALAGAPAQGRPRRSASVAPPAPVGPIIIDPGAGLPAMAEVVLAAHNRERASLNLPPLFWDAKLAAHAQAWANRLASVGYLQHADEVENPNEGENLWMGTQGAYKPVEMVGGWLGERNLFRYGKIPAVSTTGKFEDVGHYTQIVWRETTHVGCATASGDGWDFMVCRYDPPGNFTGEAPY